MFDRPPLLEEPFAQTLSGKNFGMPISGVTEANNKYLQNFTNTNLQIVWENQYQGILCPW